ncbi:hypothetical protein BDA96_05G245800 [Sorghum bicolor]|uniref:Uncharacterized protein n=1 Tax=Sorghum bicolor TaxID=4558 RepID=A0A921R256_SORBI|nr:hypothetical protein BDA96_05G245800 [Sorghum bicolor]
MDPMQNNEGRSPFEDLTNTTNLGVGVESNKENTDAMSLKRERVKARYMAMTQEERNEKNRKRRERYHQKKLVGFQTTTESTDGYEDSDWLHRNDSYNPMQIDKDNTCTILIFLFILLSIFFLCFLIWRPKLKSCYYIYVDEYSDTCINQSGMIDMTDASLDITTEKCCKKTANDSTRKESETEREQEIL